MEKCSLPSSFSAGEDGGPDSLSLGLRPKTGGGPAKKVRCQVEGCKVDLSDVKAYYSRHRVCCLHSKTPKVVVSGIEQRFCQQCSRFHQLPEFDQGKRSCRRRLAGHNERRRKPSQVCKNLRPSSFDNNHISKTGSFVMDFTGKYELPWQQRNSPHNPLSDLLTRRPSYSVDPVVSSQECFNGVSDSSYALSLLSNNHWAVLGQPSDNNPSSSTGNGQFNSGLGLDHQRDLQFDEIGQTQHMHRSL